MLYATHYVLFWEILKFQGEAYQYAKELEEGDGTLNCGSSELTAWAAGAVNFDVFFFKPFSVS